MSLRSVARRITPLRSAVVTVRSGVSAMRYSFSALRRGLSTPPNWESNDSGPLDETAAEAVELTLIGKPVRIYVIGDSHALPLRDLIVSDAFTGRDYIVISRYISSLTAAGIVQSGKLSREFVAALETEHLVREGRFSFTSNDKKDLAINFAGGVPGSAPIIVISVGDIDLRSFFLPKITDRYDIVLPFDSPYGLNKDAQIMPYAVAYRMAMTAFQPLAEAIDKLRGMGLTRVFVMSLPPPTVNQEHFDKLHGFRCPLDTRYKTALLFNRALAETCNGVGAIMPDTWTDFVDERGYLRPEFELDGVHLNRRASVVTIRRIIGACLAKADCVNADRYELAHSFAATGQPEPASAEVESLARSFHETGLCRIAIAADTAAELANRLDFTLPVANRHARVDWEGYAIAPRSASLRTAEPSQDVLDLLHRTLYGPQISPLMQRCMGGDVWYASCLPIQSHPSANHREEPEPSRTEPTPPHVLRAFLCLDDANDGNGPFDYEDARGQAGRITGPKGTFVIFDPRRLSHRTLAPSGQARKSIDFVILPRTKSQPRLVLWSGMNRWPGDPFCFSVNRLRASPPVTVEIMETNPLSG